MSADADKNMATAAFWLGNAALAYRSANKTTNLAIAGKRPILFGAVFAIDVFSLVTGYWGLNALSLSICQRMEERSLAAKTVTAFAVNS